MEDDSRNFLRLSEEFVAIEEKFDRTYWNLRLAENVLWFSALLVGLFSTFHIVRGLFLGAATKSKKWTTAAVVAVAWIIGGAISAAVQLAVARPVVEQISLADLDPGPLESVADLERVDREGREEIKAQEADLRGSFEEAKAWCPGLSNYDLW